MLTLSPQSTATAPPTATPSASSAHEAARFIANVSLSLGALMLSLFGIIERFVSFEKLGVAALPFAVGGGLLAAALVLHDMLTRDRALKSALTIAFAALLIAVMILDVTL